MNRPDAETQREDRTTGEERYWEYVAAKASLVDDVDDMRQPSSGLARFARRAEFNSLRSGVGYFLPFVTTRVGLYSFDGSNGREDLVHSMLARSIAFEYGGGLAGELPVPDPESAGRTSLGMKPRHE